MRGWLEVGRRAQRRLAARQAIDESRELPHLVEAVEGFPKPRTRAAGSGGNREELHDGLLDAVGLGAGVDGNVGDLAFGEDL